MLQYISPTGTYGGAEILRFLLGTVSPAALMSAMDFSNSSNSALIGAIGI